MDSEQLAERSGMLFDSGLFCAESVLKAAAELKGLKSELIPRMATGLCSGVSRTCGMCGAVSGAVLAIGAFAGRDDPSQSVNAAYERVQGFVSAFKADFGSTNCSDLIGCDLGTEQGQRFFRENKLRDRCRHITVQAARILSGFLP